MKRVHLFYARLYIQFSHGKHESKEFLALIFLFSLFQTKKIHSFHYTLFRRDLTAIQVPNYANYHASTTQQYKNTDSLYNVFPDTHSFVCLCIF